MDANTQNSPVIFSPFSSKARRLASHSEEILKDKSKALFGFKHCRSVSVLLNIGAHANVNDEDDGGPDEDGYGPLLFPIKDGDKRDVVLVNPYAFDNDGLDNKEGKENGGRKRIVGKVTVETARLVAEVSNVSSEDWARKFRYDEIMWPSTRSGTQLTQSIDTMTALARAAAHDALTGRNSTICTVGECAKSSLLFGDVICKSVSLNSPNPFESTSHECGLLGQIMEILHNASIESHRRCLLSIVEVVDEEIFRDVLGFAYHELNELNGHTLKLCHIDQKGAMLQNLHQIPVRNGDTMKEVTDAFLNKKLIKIWSKEGGHGHILATINVEGGGMIQLLDCANADRLCPLSSNLDDLACKQKHDRRMNNIRKSLSALRGVFRALVVAQDMNESSSINTSPSVSFRECSITQLLQRCLYSVGNDQKSNVVVIGAVSPSLKAYSQTLSTMDFTTRLNREWNTASDPFHNKLGAGEKKIYNRDSFKNSALASVLPLERDGEDGAQLEQEYSFHSKSRPSTVGSRSARPTDGTVLKSIVSDPRQRLAKLLSSASLANDTKKDEERDNYAIDTPSSIASEDLKAEFQKNYDTVFDQLDTLMSADEDDIDKRSYGNSLIEALSERKPSKDIAGPLNGDISAKQLFSPELSWSRPESLMHTPGVDREGYFGRSLCDDSKQGQNDGVSGARSLQNIPSVVVCDDPSCRDTVMSERDAGHSNSDYEVKATNSGTHDVPNALAPQAVTQAFPTKNNLDPYQIEKDVVSVNSENSIKALQSQVDKFLTSDNDLPYCAITTAKGNPANPLTVGVLQQADSNDIDDEGNLSDVLSTESEHQTIKDLQARMDKVLIDTDVSYCSSRIAESEHEDAGSDRQNIFVKSSSKLLPLNKLLSNDSMDSEPLLSCRSHATQFFGSLHASQATTDHPTREVSKEECDRRCAFFVKEGDAESIKTDPLDLNEMMTTFEKEIDTIMQSEELTGAANHKCHVEVLSTPVTTTSNKSIDRHQSGSNQVRNAQAKATTQNIEVLHNVSHSTTQTDMAGDELSSLKNRIQLLSETKLASESFVRRLETIVHGDNASSNDSQSIDSSSRLAKLEHTIIKNHGHLNELKASLRANESELEAAYKEARAAKRNLEEETTKYESEVENFSTFVSQIDSMLQPVSNQTPTTIADSIESQRSLCIARIKDLQTQIVQKESDHTESIELINNLKSKVTKLQESERILTSQYNDLNIQNNKLLGDLSEVRSAMNSRDDEILKLKSSLKSFSSKTAEIMKARIKEIKAHHAAQIASSDNAISNQSMRIKELEEIVNSHANSSHLTTHEIADLRAEKDDLTQRIKQLEDAASLKLRNIDDELVRTRNTLLKANADASKHQAENKSLKVELAHLRDVMSIAEESVGELHRLRQENEYLRRSLNRQRGHETLSSSVESKPNGIDEDQIIHERISALMRESEQGNISMRTLQKENATLKASIGECHNEMAVMRREMKNNFRLLTSARNASPVISEKSGITYTTSSLKTPMEHRPRSEYYFNLPSSTLQTEDTSYSEGQLIGQLSAEKELRYKAEEICADVLANTQAGYDKRDAEIKKLRAKLFKLSSTKY